MATLEENRIDRKAQALLRDQHRIRFNVIYADLKSGSRELREAETKQEKWKILARLYQKSLRELSREFKLDYQKYRKLIREAE